MKDRSQFGDDQREMTPGLVNCASLESLLAEAAEGTLPEMTARKLEAHLAVCPACRALVQQASRGREWLQVLKHEALETPTDLVAKILAQTSGEVIAGTVGMLAPGRRDARYTASAAGVTAESGSDLAAVSGAVKAPAVPSWQSAPIAVMRRTLVEPRLALVAAMAFFSISLTMNLMGVRLTNVRPSDFTPQHLRRAVTRQYAQANARVVRYYENLRIVYEVESRVQELRRAAETTAPAGSEGTGGGSSAPSRSQKQHKGSSKSSDDQSQADGHHLAINPAKGHRHFTAPVVPKPISIGPVIEAALHATGELRFFNGNWPRAAQKFAPMDTLRLPAAANFVMPERSLA